MNTVFILGAGASKPAGGPLMADFLDKAYLLWRRNPTGEYAAFEDVFSAMSDLRGVFENSDINRQNIEELFSTIEMAGLLGKLADRSESEIIKLRQSMVTLIYKTIEASIPVRVRNGSPSPLAAYGEFANRIFDAQTTRSGDYSWCSFITFNYDVALDYSFHLAGVRFTYHQKQGIPATQGFPLLKLHGSINWGRCQVCEEIVEIEMRDLKFHPLQDSNVPLNVGTKIQSVKHCGQAVLGPLIIPPSWDKTSYHSDLSNVWRQACNVLGQAENIVVIGYSLQETDAFFRYLFALGSDSRTLIRRFWVFDPDSSASDRFKSFIGRGIEDKFLAHPLAFESAMGIINEVLQDP